MTSARLSQSDAEAIGSTDLLEVVAVTKAFRRGPPWRRQGIEVLQGASPEVSAGELVGLVGDNSSGKSALMQIIVGLLARDGGPVARAGKLGYCPQQPLLWEKLTINEPFELFARAYEFCDVRADASSDALTKELGMRVEAVVPRLLVLGTATLIVVVVSLVVTALSFTPASWPVFTAGNLLADLSAWPQLALSFLWLAALAVAVGLVLRRALRAAG